VSATLFGIKNCDTIKKARKWLEGNGIDYQFHDFRSDGIDKNLIDSWLKQVEWETLLNTRGTTWRKLPNGVKKDISKTRAVKIMLENPAIIKRPVLSVKNKLYVGFKDEEYKEIFK
jgi:arsenate reductase